MLTLLFMFISSIALANEDKFDDFDEINRSEQNIDLQASDDSILDVQIVPFYRGKIFINNSYDSVKSAKTQQSSDNKSLDDINKSVESFDQMAFQIEQNIKFNLYDDIRLDIPISFSYTGSYDSSAIAKLENENGKTISRITNAKVGFWLDWFALPFMKLGIRGGQDSTNGYMLSIKNKLYSDSKGLNESGFDVLDWNTVIFTEFLVKNSLFSFEPEIRFQIEKGHLAVGDDPNNASIIFNTKLLLPTKLYFQLLEDLSLKMKADLGADYSFSGESSASAGKFGNNSGIGFYFKLATNLEYKIIDVAKLRLPFTAAFNARFNNELNINPSISLDTKPELEIDFQIFSHLSILLESMLDYKFMKVSFGDETKFNFLTSPTFRWGVGFRYNSAK